MSNIRKHLEQCGAFFGEPAKLDAFILNHGRSFEVGPATFSGRRGPAGQCYRNATLLAQFGGGNYVEGYVTVHGIPIQHAWTVDREGKLIDPTLPDNPTSRVGEYFGVEFGLHYLTKSLRINKVYGLLDVFHNRKTIVDLIEGRADFAPKEKVR